MDNYEFCAEWVLDQGHKPNTRVLDYGCGYGQLVKELHKRGLNAFGCDVFYGGGGPRPNEIPTVLGTSIKKMDGHIIPFDDMSFDFVVNNQVMEHMESTEDLENALKEIHRVLTPGGMVLSLFPDKSVWREGHCGVPFLHWFPKATRPRIYYLAAWRTVGFGSHKGKLSIMQWSRHKCEWYDKWTYYRSLEQIHSIYDTYFVELQHIEDYWLQRRLGRRKSVVRWLPVFAQQLAVRKLGGLVLTARKHVGRVNSEPRSKTP